MSEIVQISFRVPVAAKDALDRLACERNLPRAVLFRQLLGFGQAMDDARRVGHYVGTTPDREALAVVLVSPL